MLSIVAGEGFARVTGAERLLSAREERQRAANEVNTSRWVATVRVETAMAFTLLAFGAHLPGATAVVTPKGPAKAQMQVLQGRAEQVRSFVEAYQKRHGRDPTFSDVRNDLKLPPSTASVYLRKALA